MRPEQREIAFDLLLQQCDGVRDAGLLGDRRSIEEWPTDEYEVRAQRQRLDDVGAAPHEMVALAAPLVAGPGCALVFSALGVGSALRRVLPANRWSAIGVA